MTMKMKRLLNLCLTLTIFLFSVEVSSAAEKKVSTGFRQMIIKTEGLLIDILNEFEDKDIWMTVGQGNNQINGFDTRRKVFEKRDRIQLFDEPFSAKLASASPKYGYCAGSFELAQMYVAPMQLDSRGEAYVWFICGPFTEFNCEQKCRIDVRAGRWGKEERNYGKFLYIDHYSKGNKEVKHLKKDLQNAILEAGKSLLDP